MHERMPTRYRHFNYSNVMSTLSVFLVIAGGSAFAAALPKSSVKSKTVKDNQLTSVDLKDGAAVSGADVVDDSLTGRDVDESTLAGIGGAQGPTGPQGAIGPPGPRGLPGADGSLTGPAGGSLTGTYPNPSLAPNSVDGGQIVAGAVDTEEVEDNGLLGADITFDTLTGSDIQESTLGQVPSATLGGLGRSGGAGDTCNPAAEGFATCETVDITIPPGGARLLLIGRVNAFVESGGSRGVGVCRLDNVVGTQAFTSAPAVVEGTDSDVVTLLDVITGVLVPGPHSFGISCNELGATTIDYDEAAVDAVALSPS